MIALVAVALAVTVTQAAPAPMRIEPSSMVYVEASDFGQALGAAILKKKVPVIVTTMRDKATFYIEETSRSEKEGTGERVAKVLAFGVFAGSGKSYEASVSLTNADGALIFAHNSKKADIRRAAEDVAERLEEFMKRQKR